MKRRCADQPGPRGLTDGPGCGLFYDDAERSTICPHRELNPWTYWPTILATIVVMQEGLEELGLGHPMDRAVPAAVARVEGLRR